MPGPGGREVGRVSIRVVPDLSGFLTSVRAFLARAQSTLRIELPVTVNSVDLIRDLRDAIKLAQAAAPTLDVSGNIDAAKLAADVKAAVAAAQAAAGEIDVKVNVDKSALARVSSAFNGGGGGGGLSGRAKLFVALGLAAAGATPSILAVAGGLAQVVGAAALLPAVGAAAALGVGALAVGLSGVGDAIKYSGDPKYYAKYVKTLERLSPAAQSFVKAIVGMRPAAKALKDEVQNTLFDGLATQAQALGGVYLPLVGAAMAGIADSANHAVKDVSAFLKATSSVADIKTALSNSGGAFDALFAAVKPLAGALLDFVTVGSTFLPGLAGGARDAATQFADFIANARKTGELRKFIADGLAAIGELATVAYAAGRAVYGIITAAQNAGGGTLTALAGGLTTIADVINGPAFQAGLTTFFRGLQDGFSAFTRSFPAVGAALAAIAPAFASVAVALGTGLGAALTGVADVIIRLAPDINRFAGFLADLSPKILGAVTAALLLGPAFLSIAGTVTGVVAAIAALSLPVLAVVAGLALLGAALLVAYRSSTTFRDGVKTIAEGVVSLYQSAMPPLVAFIRGQLIPGVLAIVTAFRGFVAAVVPIVQQVAAVFAQHMPQVLAVVRQVFSTVGTVITGAMTLVRTVITVATAGITALWGVFGSTILATVNRVFPAILSAISGVLNTVQGVVRTFTALLTGNWSAAWDGVKQVVSGAGQAITGIVRGVFALLTGIVSIALTGIKAAFSAGWNALTGIVSAAGQAIAGAVRARMADAKGAVDGAISQIKAAFSAGWHALTGIVSGAMTAVQSAVTSGVGRVVATVAALPGRISGALGNLGSLLYSAGADVVNGLVNGITQAGGRAVAAARNLASSVANAAKGALGISSPSKVMIAIGRYVGEGLVQGLEGSITQVRDAATRLVNQIKDAASSYAKSKDVLTERLDAQTAALAKASKAQRAVILAQIAATKGDLKELDASYLGIGRNPQADERAIHAITVTQGQLEKIAAARERIAVRLDKARTALADAVQVRNDFAKNVKASIVAFGGILSVKGGVVDQAQVKSLTDTLSIASDKVQVARTAEADATSAVTAAQEELSKAQAAGADTAAAAAVKVTTAQRQQQAAAAALGSAMTNQLKVQEALDVTNQGVALSSQLIVQGLRDRLAAVKDFVSNLATLQARGLNDTSYRQLVDAGVEGGAAAAEVLASSGRDVVNQINHLTAEIAKEGGALGNTAAGNLYQAGVDAAKGLVEGLKSQASALAAAADELAARLVSQVRAALGIASPSRVMARDVGLPVVTGIIRGLDQGQSILDRRMSALVPTPTLADVGGSHGAGGGVEMSGTFYSYDPSDLLRAADLRARDAAVVANLAALTVGV